MSILRRILGGMRDAAIRYAFRDRSMHEEEVARALDARASAAPERLDWRRSIVDLMKLLELDWSLEARKSLAQELGYDGALDGSAQMNTWLHGRVMEKLAKGLIPVDAYGC